MNNKIKFKNFDEFDKYLYGDKEYVINEKETKERARELLERYKTINYYSKMDRVPGITRSFSVEESSRSTTISDFLTDIEDKNSLTKTLSRKFNSGDLKQEILDGIENMVVLNKNQPTEYYRDVLRATYIEAKNEEETIVAKMKLARKYPNRVSGVMNDIELDNHIYYYDLNIALIAFAKSYESEIAPNILVYEN